MLQRYLRRSGHLRIALVRKALVYGPVQTFLRNVTGAITQKRSASFQLRKYQLDCIESVIHHINVGHKRLGVSMATGGGKTVVFTQLISRVVHSEESVKQTLIVVHRRELVEQAARHCAEAYPEKIIEIDMGSSHASGLADVTVASVWTLISKDRLAKYDAKNFKLLLVDEAHHIVSPSYMEVLKHFKLHKSNLSEKSPVLVGFSATMSRFDGIQLQDALDQIVYHKDFVDMIQEKWLSDLIFTTVDSRTDLRSVKSPPGQDFLIRDLSKAVNTPDANQIVVQTWSERAVFRKSTLVFCVDVAHVVDLTAVFRARSVNARFITGNTPTRERVRILDAFKAGHFPVLLNCGVFTEGTDIPNIDCVLLARPTKSRNLLVQMVGRGMRLHPEKKDCHVIDMVNSLETGIVTTPTLFGLDPSTLVTEQNGDAMRMAQAEQKVKKVPLDVGLDYSKSLAKGAPQSLSFKTYDCVLDLIADTAGERHVRTMSQFAWVMVSPTRYILTSQDGSYLSLEELGRGADVPFRVLYTKRISTDSMAGSNTKSPYWRPRVIASAEKFSDALHAADTFASQRLQWKYVKTNQIWRRMPATNAQIAFLNRLRSNAKKLEAGLSKGKAADMITKVKFGAKAWLDRLARSKD